MAKQRCPVCGTMNNNINTYCTDCRSYFRDPSKKMVPIKATPEIGQEDPGTLSVPKNASREIGDGVKDVFGRTAATSSGNTLSDQMYNLAIGTVLTWGFVINWLIVKYVPVDEIQSVDIRVFLVAYFLSCFAGIYIYTKYSDPWKSFLGYNLVVVPFGLVINIVVSRHDPRIVVQAMMATGLVTVSMMALGAAFPRLFRRIRDTLTTALLLVIIWELGSMVFLKAAPTVTDWIVVLIFSGYIGYDWGRANQIPKTLDNAVDSAAAIYMDVINIFLRFVRILGRKK